MHLRDFPGIGHLSTMRHLQIALALILSVATLLAADVRILVKPNDDANETAVQNAFGAHGATQVTNISQINVRVLTLPAAASTNAVEALSHNPLFAFAEFDEEFQPQFVPNDTYYSVEWFLPKIQAPSAWDTTTGRTNVVIAILDTGVESTHPDLVGKLVPGWNFYDNNANTADAFGHGTGVAGVAAAASNNGIGVASLAWLCPIMPIRISNTNGVATTSLAAQGVTWAADNGAKVANISYIMTSSAVITTAAQYLQSKGGLLTISAGNNATFDTNADNAFVLTVSATDQNDALSTFSNTGNNIDLCAPGESIKVLMGGGLYGTGTGTSLSAPIVAGVAALVMSANPNLTGVQVQQLLKNNADDLGQPGWDTSFGYGRVNAFRSVQAAIGYTGTITVTATQGCNWTASPDVSWITIINGAAGTGNGTVTYGVAANPTSTTRTGRINVAGKVFFVTQTGIACSFSLSPTSASFNLFGGPGTINITASDSICAWTATSGVPWITLLPASGSGNGAVNFTVASTSSSATRTGNLTVAGQTFVVTQTGDVTAPTVTLTAPANGSTISNIFTLSATATDNSSVARVEFYRDSILAGTVLASPYNLPFQTTNITNGAHTFYARAFDPANNQGFSFTNAVTVSNASAANTNTWALRFGAASSDSGQAVAIDSSGNIIMAGYFSGAVDFGGGTLTATGSSDIVLATYSSAGVHQWSERFGGTGSGSPSSVALDSGGNIFLTGSFSGSVDFGTGTLVSAGSSDIFLAKYSSTGTPAWSKRFGSTDSDLAYGVTIDPGGNALITGTFRGNVSFGGATLISAGTFQTPYFPGGPDVFIAKFNTGGTHQWSENFTNNTAGDEGFGIDTDSASNIYITGYYTGTIDFGGGVLPQFGASDIYLAKFNSSGVHQWSQHFGGTGADRGQAIAIDSSGNVFLTGIFTGVGNFGSASLTAASGYDVFLAKYSTAGALVWAKDFAGPNFELPATLAIDAGNNVLVGGYFQNTLNVGGTILSSAGGQDVFIGKFANDGTPVWAKSFGGPLSDNVLGVATDSNSFVVGTGFFSGVGNFNGTSLTSAGAIDIFLMRLVP